MNNNLVDNDFQTPDDFPIARVATVVVKKIGQGELITQTGLILPETLDANENNRLNTAKPNVGIIYAVGPNCKEDLQPGLRVFFSSFADATIMIGTEHYIMMEERDVLMILKPKNYVLPEIKPEKEVRLIKKQGEQKARVKVLAAKEANTRDKYSSPSKKRK